MQGRGPGPPNATGKQVLVKSCRMCHCHHHESQEEVTLLKMSARPNLWFYHLKMYFFSEIQAFHLMLPNLFIYHVYFMMICFLDLLLQKHKLIQGRCCVTVSDNSGIIIIMFHDK